MEIGPLYRDVFSTIISRNGQVEPTNHYMYRMNINLCSSSCCELLSLNKNSFRTRPLTLAEG